MKLTMDILVQLDKSVSQTLALLFPHTPLFQHIFSFFSLSGGSFAIWFVLMILVILFEEKKNKVFILYLFLSFFITSILVNYGFKWIFMRERPYIQSGLAALSCPSDYSFPSGHGAVAFASYVIFATFDKKRKWFYLSVALLISYSRIYLYCHFLSDVLAGALLGAAVSTSILLIGKPKQK